MTALQELIERHGPLLHYSPTPPKRVKSVRQDDNGDSFKPRGLWFSVGDGEDSWRAWCEGEEFGVDRLVSPVEIVPARDARILALSTPRELDDFTKQYRSTSKLSQLSSLYEISWEKVASEYQGIAIAPYMWERRFELSWYYPWDCASGCIWDSAAVSSIKSREAANA